jgi:para-nitrobenzyl esterase
MDAATSTLARPDPLTRRMTRSGAVVGVAGPYESHVWYGIPYAKSPVGALRWRAPQPADPWERDLEAMQPPSPCCQVVYGDPAGAVVGSEDCLYLTVWAPRLKPDEARTRKLPVILWIHGGGNRIGNGAEQCAGRLAASQEMIVVSVNYRLDFFGWFFHRSLRGEGSRDAASGNFGTLDQICALEWVRDNIASFGGDPQCVTIMGESAGGHNILALLQSPRAAGLFHRAMPMSAANYELMTVAHAQGLVTDPVPGHPVSSSEMLLSLLLLDDKAADAARAREVLAAMADADVAAYLRSQTYQRLLQAVAQCRQRNAGLRSAEAHTQWANDNNPLLCDDGVVIRGDWHNAVPVMIGCTRFEDRTFLADDPRHVIFEGPRNRLRDKPWYLLFTDYMGQLYRANAVDEWAARFADKGSAVYSYRFDWDELAAAPGDDDYVDLRGAEHGSELPLFLGTAEMGKDFAAMRLHYDVSAGSSFERMAAPIMSYVAQFARTGDPARGRAGDQLEWQRWDGQNFMVLDSPPQGLRMAQGRLTRQAVLDAVVADPRLASSQAMQRFIDDTKAHFISSLTDADYQKLRAAA